MEQLQQYWPVLLVTIPLLALIIELLTMRFFMKDDATLLNRLTTVLMLAVMLTGIYYSISYKLFESKVIIVLLILVIVISTISLQIKRSSRKNKKNAKAN